MTATTTALPHKDKPGERSHGYGLISRTNHWINALFFLAALSLGLVIGYGGLARDAVGGLMDWHKFFGVAALGYGLWRVGWRLAKGFPPSEGPMARWQKTAAKLVHIGLLVAIVVMPLSGVLMSVAGGRALDVWGLTLVPSLGNIGWLGAAVHALHEAVPPVILLLLALHIGGALLHHFVLRDNTLRAMASGRI